MNLVHLRGENPILAKARLAACLLERMDRGYPSAEPVRTPPPEWVHTNRRERILSATQVPRQSGSDLTTSIYTRWQRIKPGECQEAAHGVASVRTSTPEPRTSPRTGRTTMKNTHGPTSLTLMLRLEIFFFFYFPKWKVHHKQKFFFFYFIYLLQS